MGETASMSVGANSKNIFTVTMVVDTNSKGIFTDSMTVDAIFTASMSVFIISILPDAVTSMIFNLNNKTRSYSVFRKNFWQLVHQKYQPEI